MRIVLGVGYSGMWRKVAGLVFPDVSQEVSAVIFKDEGVQEEFCAKVGKHWPIDTAHTADAFWKRQISHTYCVLCDIIFNCVCVRVWGQESL
jgi:hypothetical protein